MPKYSQLLLLVLISVLTACSNGSPVPQTNGVSIARRGQSLVGFHTGGIAQPTAGLQAATAQEPAPTKTPEPTEVPTEKLTEPSVIPTPQVELTDPPSTSETTDRVCDPETDRRFMTEVIALVNAARVEAGGALGHMGR